MEYRCVATTLEGFVQQIAGGDPASETGRLSARADQLHLVEATRRETVWSIGHEPANLRYCPFSFAVSKPAARDLGALESWTRSTAMNPEDRVTIERVDLGTGWVCFQAGEPPPAPDVLPKLLSHAMTTWLERNTEFHVKAVLPIVLDGNTQVLHVWFE